MKRAIAIDIEDARLIRDLITDEVMDNCTLQDKERLLKLKYGLWQEVERADRMLMAWAARKGLAV